MLAPSLPFVLAGVLSLLGALVSINLPETADAALPNTLEEAEDFGRDFDFFHPPAAIMRRREARKKTISKMITPAVEAAISPTE